MSRFLRRDTVFAIALVPLLAVSAAAQATSDYPGLASEPSAASKFSSSVKSGFSKMSKALMPHSPTKTAPDPISLSVPAKPSAEFHVAVARMAEQSGDLAKAEHHYREALKLAPADGEALASYAHMLDRQGKLEQAKSLYEMAVKSQPANATAYNDLGICCARQGKLDEAVASLEKAIQLQPEQSLYRNNIATILVQSKQLDAAFSHLSAVHPRAVAFYNLGFLLQKTGDKEGAARLFEEALSLDASLTEAQVWLRQLRPAVAAAGPAGQRQQVPSPPRQPQVIAQRPAPVATGVVPPAGSPAPMPMGDGPTPPPQIQLMPTSGAAPGAASPQRLAPLPSIRPLPPVHGRQ